MSYLKKVTVLITVNLLYDSFKIFSIKTLFFFLSYLRWNWPVYKSTAWLMAVCIIP